MTIQEFAALVGLPREAADCIRHSGPSAARRGEYLGLFERDEEAFFERLRGERRPERLALCLLARYAMQREPEWRAAGIPGPVYRDTMRDLALWYRECVRRTGGPGLVEWDWLALSLKGRVLRLGRLQYRPCRLKAGVRAGGRVYGAGAAALEVHIPADGPLRPGEAEGSIAQARAFPWRERPALLHCHSWLLSPALQRLLPQGSNILRFQSLFTVYGEDFRYREAEERVFGGVRGDLGGYPESTSLQTRLKRFLLDGGSVGMGSGAIPWEGPAEPPGPPAAGQ